MADLVYHLQIKQNNVSFSTAQEAAEALSKSIRKQFPHHAIQSVQDVTLPYVEVVPVAVINLPEDVVVTTLPHDMNDPVEVVTLPHDLSNPVEVVPLSATEVAAIIGGYD